MKITSDITEYHKIYHIHPYDGRSSMITVEIGKLFTTDTWSKPTISWCAIGTVNIDDAKLFTDGLKEAIKIARELEQERFKHD
jgi:hypothetical protein